MFIMVLCNELKLYLLYVLCNCIEETVIDFSNIF